MQFARHFTKHLAPNHGQEWSPQNIHNAIQWKKFDILIGSKSKPILEMEVEAPATWFQNAVDILAHKYLRKSGVPNRTAPSVRTDDESVPRWLDVQHPAIGSIFGRETSAKQVFHRLAGHWTYEAFKAGYFDAHSANSEDNNVSRETHAQIFYDEIFWMLSHQMAAPNSPQWFNTGLYWAYGIAGDADTNLWRAPHIGHEATNIDGCYITPQVSACFILGVDNNLVQANGILDTLRKEATIFKYGSGSGINFSTLQAVNTPLKNGGVSSGVMSFLKIFDTATGSIKSGGTTRRAASMRIIDADHPEALQFVEWKSREEAKAKALIQAGKSARNQKENAAITQIPTDFDTNTLAEITDFYEGDAYTTVSGQNSNNSLRVTDTFMKGLREEPSKVSSDRIISEVTRNQKLFDKATEAAHRCGDPGMQFHDTINRWHTIPKHSEQRATNPCSEYSFIDNSSCNLASLNLVNFLSSITKGPEAEFGVGHFDSESFRYACRMWTIVLDVSVGMASYPDKQVAENSVNYRAIGLGYANLGGLLLLLGVPYDSNEGRRVAAMITAVMHGQAGWTSAEIAGELGAFHDFDLHASDTLNVWNMHKKAVSELGDEIVANSNIPHGQTHPLHNLFKDLADLWGLSDNKRPTEFRNAQLTLLAPTGTIGMVMDCTATGIEPCFSLHATKKLAGGGQMTLVNELVGDALTGLGYTNAQISDIEQYIAQHGNVGYACPHILPGHMKIFDCANDIDPITGHVGMMAAVQPFLSGAISKTVNMPKSATVDDVKNVYLTAWQQGLKAVAIYRDGCKDSQPVTASASNGKASATAPVVPPTRTEIAGAINTKPAPTQQLSTRALPPRGQISSRYKLPSKRNGFTIKVNIGGQSLYLRTGEYPDGRLGEVFLSIGKEGSGLRHMVDTSAMLISIALQHGVPLESIRNSFIDSKSDPSGLVIGSDTVRTCTSIIDYVVRELWAQYGSKETVLSIEVQSPEPGEHKLSIEPALGAQGPEVVLPLKREPLKLITSNIPGVEGGTGELQAGAVRTMAQKYSGDACRECHEYKLVRSGSCYTCQACGTTTGCS
jgi:ribonucleoside-diphosphate reductase alpha chain